MILFFDLFNKNTMKFFSMEPEDENIRKYKEIRNIIGTDIYKEIFINDDYSARVEMVSEKQLTEVIPFLKTNDRCNSSSFTIITM